MSDHITSGSVNGGNPCGSTPIVSTPRSVRSRKLTVRAVSTTTISTLGSLGSNLFSSRMPTSEAMPTTAAVMLAAPWRTPVTTAPSSRNRPSASTENPNSLGSWLMTMVSARPFM